MLLRLSTTDIVEDCPVTRFLRGLLALHQYADDTQLHLAMRVDNTAAGLSILVACTTEVKQNGL